MLWSLSPKKKKKKKRKEKGKVCGPTMVTWEFGVKDMQISLPGHTGVLQEKALSILLLKKEFKFSQDLTKTQVFLPSNKKVPCQHFTKI